jgi:hypothetical protein
MSVFTRKRSGAQEKGAEDVQGEWGRRKDGNGTNLDLIPDAATAVGQRKTKGSLNAEATGKVS